jgi:hypothetical protein
MPETSLVKRLETLENAVNGPNGLTRQIAAVAGELKEFRGEFLQFRDWTRGEFSAVRQEMATEFAVLRQEMATRSEMRMLHEEVIARLAVLQEGQVRRKPSPRSPKRR